MLTKRQDAIHAFHILNYFVGDLVVATQVRRCFQAPGVASQTSPTTTACVDRMCLSYLILTLDKWDEFYQRFQDVIPDDCRDHCELLRGEIRRRKIRQFRNAFVGHIWDNKLRRPRTGEEIQAAVDFIVGGDEEAFSTWCNSNKCNEWPKTVVSIVERTRDRIRDEFALADGDLFAGAGRGLTNRQN